MEINWNFIELMRKGRETYINNKTFHEFFEKNCDVKVNDKILDVGCGIGTVPRLLYKIYQKSIKIYGIDLDPNLIKWGQKHWGKFENIHLAQGNVYNLDFPSNEFDIITSFGLIEWLDEPLIALDEMIRVNKPNGKFITLVIEKSKYEKFPINRNDQEFYKDYLKGIKKLGYPIENEGKYIQDLFLKREFETISYEFLIENKTVISTKLLELWEKAFNQTNFLDFAGNSMDFYFQFLEKVGWTKERLLDFIEKEFSLENVLEFYRAHIGEEIAQHETIDILESTRIH